MVQNTLKKRLKKEYIHTQVLQRLLVLRHCLLMPYVPLLALAVRTACVELLFFNLFMSTLVDHTKNYLFLFFVRTHTLFRIQNLLTDTNILWCNLNKFIIFDEVKGLLKAQYLMWYKL